MAGKLTYFKYIVVATVVSLVGARVIEEQPAINALEERQTIFCPLHQSVGTFFCSGTDPNQITACGNVFDPNAPGVAISTAILPNFEAIQPYCGDPIIFELPNGNQLSAPIIDLCATCTEGEFQLDLSPRTFSDLGGNPDCNQGGQLDITWFLENDHLDQCF
ncbi:hypothetical protein F5884DRAFT_874060 [Xylogone sp. PMI_703]|nr:hypothetical protein F5884DRAFT_874060 [Xylogone sp. PMI_703]